jgi:hypothetical protein
VFCILYTSCILYFENTKNTHNLPTSFFGNESWKTTSTIDITKQLGHSSAPDCLSNSPAAMADLQELFEKSQANLNDSKMEFTSGETANFKKAFDDPEFRKMFTEYMDEMQDPNNKKVN